MVDPGEFIDMPCPRIHQVSFGYGWVRFSPYFSTIAASDFSSTWNEFKKLRPIQFQLSFPVIAHHAQLPYPGSATIFLFRYTLYYCHGNAMWLLIGRAVRFFSKLHRFFVVCTQTHNHNQPYYHMHAIVVVVKVTSIFFYKKKMKNVRYWLWVLQKFLAFYDIFIDVFVSDLNEEIDWWSLWRLKYSRTPWDPLVGTDSICITL